MAVTSANALRALDRQGATATYCHLPLYAVGDRTAEVARELGFTRVRSAGGDFGDLVDLLVHSGIGGPILYPAPRDPSAPSA